MNCGFKENGKQLGEDESTYAKSMSGVMLQA